MNDSQFSLSINLFGKKFLIKDSIIQDKTLRIVILIYNEIKKFKTYIV